MALEHDKIGGLYKEEEEIQKAYDKQIINSEELAAKRFIIKNAIRKLLSLLPAE